MMRTTAKQFIKLFTLFTTLALSLLWSWEFLLMYLNGGTVLIDCITYGEQYIEYPMMALFVPLLTYGTWLNYKEISNDGESTIRKEEEARP